MELVLLRHADAGDQDPARYPDDRLRPLTDEGRRTQRAIARALQRMGVAFDHLLTSPLARARETAAITGELVECKSEIEAIPALGDDYSADALLGALSFYNPDSRIGCVGHEPYLSGFAAACLDPSLAVRLARATGRASGSSTAPETSRASRHLGPSLTEPARRLSVVSIDLPKSGIIGLAFDGSPTFGAARLKYVLRSEHLLALID
jgi:phosphohistidine phosphatase